MVESNQILMLSAGMFVLGMIGFLTRKNMILMFLAVELMLAAVSLNFVVFGTMYGLQQGQLFAILILTVASCEAAIGLALVVALYRRKSTLDIGEWAQLYEVQAPKQRSAEVEVEEPVEEYPTLTPAGLAPGTERDTVLPARMPNERA